jgi:FkbM family methyltransferase
MGVSTLEYLRQFLGGGFRRLANQLMPHGPSGRTMAAALRRLAATREVRTVVDVGASNGRWSLLARRHFPQARYLLIEAQATAHEPALRRLHARWPQMEYVLAAAGAGEGTVYFDRSDPLGGLASDQPLPGDTTEVPVTTVDLEVSRRGLQGAYLLKLDTHGYEMPILEGAAATLRRAEAVIAETYNFDICATAYRFGQMTLWLEERGFRCVDLVDVLHRPGDGALWQMDLVFVPEGSAEFRRRTYRP